MRSEVDVAARSAIVSLSLDVESLSATNSTVAIDWSIRRDGKTVVERHITYDVRGADRSELTAEFLLDDVDLCGGSDTAIRPSTNPPRR